MGTYKSKSKLYQRILFRSAVNYNVSDLIRVSNLSNCLCVVCKPSICSIVSEEKLLCRSRKRLRVATDNDMLNSSASILLIYIEDAAKLAVLVNWKNLKTVIGFFFVRRSELNERRYKWINAELPGVIGRHISMVCQSPRLYLWLNLRTVCVFCTVGTKWSLHVVCNTSLNQLEVK